MTIEGKVKEATVVNGQLALAEVLDLDVLDRQVAELPQRERQVQIQRELGDEVVAESAPPASDRHRGGSHPCCRTRCTFRCGYLDCARART